MLENSGDEDPWIKIIWGSEVTRSGRKLAKTLKYLYAVQTNNSLGSKAN